MRIAAPALAIALLTSTAAVAQTCPTCGTPGGGPNGSSSSSSLSGFNPLPIIVQVGKTFTLVPQAEAAAAHFRNGSFADTVPMDYTGTLLVNPGPLSNAPPTAEHVFFNIAYWTRANFQSITDEYPLVGNSDRYFDSSFAVSILPAAMLGSSTPVLQITVTNPNFVGDVAKFLVPNMINNMQPSGTTTPPVNNISFTLGPGSDGLWSLKIWQNNQNYTSLAQQVDPLNDTPIPRTPAFPFPTTSTNAGGPLTWHLGQKVAPILNTAGQIVDWLADAVGEPIPGARTYEGAMTNVVLDFNPPADPNFLNYLVLNNTFQSPNLNAGTPGPVNFPTSATNPYPGFISQAPSIWMTGGVVPNPSDPTGALFGDNNGNPFYTPLGSNNCPCVTIDSIDLNGD